MERCLVSKTDNCKNCYKCIRSCRLKAISFENDRASILFEEATDVNIFSGCAVNPVHQNNSSLSISLKMKLVDELIAVLKKLNKSVKVTYY